MSFLPDNYEPPKSQGKYLKLTQGAHRIRILSKSITGYEVWAANQATGQDRYPFRFKELKDINVKPSKPGDQPKHFWAMKIWNYDTEQIQIAQFTQKTIQSLILDFYNNTDYGDPKGYDITITRKGEGKDNTTYTAVPSPPKELSEEVKQANENTLISLEALYDGGDPFEATESVGSTEEKTDSKENLSPEEMIDILS